MKFNRITTKIQGTGKVTKGATVIQTLSQAYREYQFKHVSSLTLVNHILPYYDRIPFVSIKLIHFDIKMNGRLTP